jgi:hypothetical protein
MTSTVPIISGDLPAMRTARDFALFLQDCAANYIPNAAERAEILRRMADVLWTRTANVVEALEVAATECDPAAHEPEPVEYDLGDEWDTERVIDPSDDVSHPDAFDAFLAETRGETLAETCRRQ